jgi:diguanylate cyclase (GGDEF)-like protein/PAS domain S-box-containing protein
VQADGRLRAAGAGGDLPRGQLEELAAGWLPLLAGQRPAFVPVTVLGDRAAALYPECEGALLCPLMLADRPSGDPLIGVLAAFGPQAALAGLAGTLETLAGQVALAVERIMLSREVTQKRSEEYFRTLVQDASEAILIVGDAGEVRYATPSAAGFFGDAAVMGRTLPDLAGPDGREEVSRALARMRDRARPGHHEELWRLSGRDGRPVQVTVRCSDLRGDPTVEGLVLTLRDVTEERRLNDQLKHLAFHDPLTGLPNRRLFQDRAARAVAAARRGGHDAAVVFVDLDDFKMVNDTKGHATGDALLAAVGKRLSEAVRESDTAARLGGDEFALLIERIADPAEADALADRLMRAFSSPFSILGRQVVVAATAGVATTRDSGDADELLRHADLALYAAKSEGKRQWRRYQPAHAAGMIRRQEMRSALDEALSSSAFTLAYQPIVALDSGGIVGFEALVRWLHPDWGLMMPGEFIALAEETGHIVQLGDWVLRQAARDMGRWQAQAPSDLYVSVNVSARQFLVPGFAGSVADALASAGLDPRALLLELTESALLDRDERVDSALREVKRAGVRLAIDDFGTGYSTLSYLQELPIDVLKIDKSFIDGVTSSPRRQVLVEGIIAIASGLSLQVIAEGIETEEQRETLIAAGCHYGQGYLLAKPAGPDQAAELIRRRQPLVPGLTR